MNQLRKAAFKSDSKSSHWDRFPMRRFFASTSTHTQTQRFGETANLSESRGEIFNKAGINAALPPSIGLLQSHSRRVTLRCCKCLKFSYNRNMKYAKQHSSHRRALGIGGRLHHCPGTAPRHQQERPLPRLQGRAPRARRPRRVSPLRCAELGDRRAGRDLEAHGIDSVLMGAAS